MANENKAQEEFEKLIAELRPRPNGDERIDLEHFYFIGRKHGFEAGQKEINASAFSLPTHDKTIIENAVHSTAKAIFKELDQFIINNQLFGEHKISVDTPIVITYFEIKRKYLKPSDKTLSNSFDKKD